jgi:hypothetical protein
VLHFIIVTGAWSPLFLQAHIACITTNLEDDRRHRYATPDPGSKKLMIHANHYGLLLCPLCPESAPHGWTLFVIREHVLAWANHRPHRMYDVDKKIARHLVLARN